MKRIWTAMINVAVVADSEGAACDVISEAMREITDLDGCFVDWAYVTYSGRPLLPVHNDDFPDDHQFEKGEVFNP